MQLWDPDPGNGLARRRPEAETAPSGPEQSADERKAILAEEVSVLLSLGWRIESQDDFTAVLVSGGRVIEYRALVTVDESGRLTVEGLPLNTARLIILAGLVCILVLILYIAIASSL